jgi:hypothetical protein
MSLRQLGLLRSARFNVGHWNVVWQQDFEPTPVAAVYKAYSWGRSAAGIASSNPAERMDICLLCLLCVSQESSHCVYYRKLKPRRFGPDFGCRDKAGWKEAWKLHPTCKIISVNYSWTANYIYTYCCCTLIAGLQRLLELMHVKCYVKLTINTSKHRD